MGFYGNSETNDGMYQLTYSLYNANRTLGSINNMVSKNVDTLMAPYVGLPLSYHGTKLYPVKQLCLVTLNYSCYAQETFYC